jgi:hypothetical protein
MDRRDVLNLHDSRMKARETLDTDIALAKTNLHPRTIADRWTAKQKTMVRQAADDATHLVKKNALLIGAVGIGALLFIGRKPISILYSKLRQARKIEQDPT